MSRRIGLIVTACIIFVSLSILLSGESTGRRELLTNPSFEDWSGGLPVGWENETDPEATLERWGEAVEGDRSIRFMNVRSYDVHVYQNITIPPGAGDSISFCVSCRIDYSEDLDDKGVHSPTGIEVGFEGGDVDDDGFAEYLYFYFFVDDDVRPEDFTELAGIYNTTEDVDIHKIALLYRMKERGRWESFNFNLSDIFLKTLGGFPGGEYKVMVWALRWGEPREDCGVTGLVDGLSVSCGISEVPHLGFAIPLLTFGILGCCLYR